MCSSESMCMLHSFSRPSDETLPSEKQEDSHTHTHTHTETNSQTKIHSLHNSIHEVKCALRVCVCLLDSNK